RAGPLRLGFRFLGGGRFGFRRSFGGHRLGRFVRGLGFARAACALRLGFGFGLRRFLRLGFGRRIGCGRFYRLCRFLDAGTGFGVGFASGIVGLIVQRLAFGRADPLVAASAPTATTTPAAGLAVFVQAVVVGMRLGVTFALGVIRSGDGFAVLGCVTVLSRLAIAATPTTAAPSAPSIAVLGAGRNGLGGLL